MTTPTPLFFDPLSVTIFPALSPTLEAIPQVTSIPSPLPGFFGDTPPTGKIVFVCYVKQIDQICLMNADGTSIRPITHDTYYNESPAWSPDGNRLAYRQGRSLFVYEVSTKTSRKLYTRYFWQPDFITHLRGALHWSPDGQYLALNVWSYSLFPLRPELTECIVIEAETRKVSAVGEDSVWCGPWLRKVS